MQSYVVCQRNIVDIWIYVGYILEVLVVRYRKLGFSIGRDGILSDVFKFFVEFDNIKNC